MEAPHGGKMLRRPQILKAEIQSYAAVKEAPKLPVVWIETSDSGDNNISFMNSAHPYAWEVMDEIMDLLFSNTFMASQGRRSLEALEDACDRYRELFTLVVEGAVPVGAGGAYSVIARTPQGDITAEHAVRSLGALAKHIISLGTCASFGGASAARPNVTRAVSVSEAAGRKTINVSGCPVNPDWFVGTLAHLMMYGEPALDQFGRPLIFYESTVHRHCQRRSYFDKGDLAGGLGDKECMFSLGCVGPKTHADCPYRLWDGHVSWPVKANTPCIGCTNPDFPDGSEPFFVPLPDKEKGGSDRDRRIRPV